MGFLEKKSTLENSTKSFSDKTSSRKRDYLMLLKQQNQFELVVKSFNHIFINDCNSTDINGCMATIDQLEGSVIWINYGPKLARNYSEIIPLIKKKVRAVFSFGPETGFVHWATEQKVEMFVKTETLKEAIILANLYAIDGETIVFAPGAEYDGKGEADWVEEFKEGIAGLTERKY